MKLFLEKKSIDANAVVFYIKDNFLQINGRKFSTSATSRQDFSTTPFGFFFSVGWCSWLSVLYAQVGWFNEM